MILIISLLLAIFFLCAGPRVQSHVLSEGAYMTRERTCMINGFFIWVVFMSHMSGYKPEFSGYDAKIIKMLGLMGQCCVATFFFYSGYGIMNGLCRGGYAKALIIKRLPTLLLYMVLAVMLYWGVQSLYGLQFTSERLLLSFIGWSGIGNSNWFIFVTLVAYILVAVAYALAHRWGDYAVVLVATLLFAAFVAALACCKEIHWYNTCLCIPAGMLFYKGRVRVEGYIEKLRIPAWCWGVLMLPVALLAYRYLGRWPYMQNAAAVFFALGVTFIFSCVTLKRLPHFLCWSGGAGLFFLYIFQRIPMLVGARAGWHTEHAFLYQCFCVAGTLVIAWIFSKLFPMLVRRIIR